MDQWQRYCTIHQLLRYLGQTGILSTQAQAPGQLPWGSENVGVALIGFINGFSNGDYYYNNSNTGGTAIGGTYGGLTPSDMIQEWGTGKITITFDQAVINPYIALVSVGQPYYTVNYTFANLQNPIVVVFSGSNYWGGLTHTGSTEAFFRGMNLTALLN